MMDRDWLDGLIDPAIEYLTGEYDEDFPLVANLIKLRAILAAPPVPLSDPEKSQDVWNFRTFTVYRTGDLSETHDENQAPPSPDEPAYWGVVFPDGTCVLRWAGVVRAHSVWASFEDAMKVHGHPEPRYGTRIEWGARAAAPEPPTPQDFSRAIDTGMERVENVKPYTQPVIDDGHGIVRRLP